MRASDFDRDNTSMVLDVSSVPRSALLSVNVSSALVDIWRIYEPWRPRVSHRPKRESQANSPKWGAIARGGFSFATSPLSLAYTVSHHPREHRLQI